jgi:hypothetical protein
VKIRVYVHCPAINIGPMLKIARNVFLCKEKYAAHSHNELNQLKVMRETKENHLLLIINRIPFVFQAHANASRHTVV